MDHDVDPDRPIPPRSRRGVPAVAPTKDLEQGGGRRLNLRDRESLIALARDLPNFVKLLGRLARDRRVSIFDKGLVVATIGYIAMPFDFVPDSIPFLGQIDDLYLLALVLNRLLHNAGADVLLDHWDGEPETLELLVSVLDKAGSVLPAGVRDILYRRVG